MAYGACDTPKDVYAARIACLIGKDGKVLEAHGKVNAATYPAEQLESLRRIAGA